MRLATAFLVAMIVVALGTVLFEELGIGGLAWYGLVLVGVLAATLVDYQNFYGSGDPPPHG